MKIVATMEENKPVNVKRFENDVLLGERNVSVTDYCNSLASELPVGAFIKGLLNSQSEVQEYLENIVDYKDFTRFMSMFIQKAPSNWYLDDNSILTMSNTFVGNLPNAIVETEESIAFVRKLVSALPEMTLSTAYYALFLEMLKKILHSKDKTMTETVSAVVFSNILNFLEKDDIEIVKSTISNIIPNLDNTWFSSMVLEAQKKTTKPIVYYSGKMPKNFDYVSVTARETTFVYDIPKQLLETMYQSQKIGKVGYPRLLFMYTLKEDGLVRSMRLFAAKEGDNLDEHMTIYEYPYSHVYGSGSVCWNFSDVTVDMMPYAHELFLSSNNSNHGRVNAFDLFMEQKDLEYDESKLTVFGKLGSVL
ncbi:MAG: hypothetical protein KBT36_01545 [Kurthia sp.]|nr:hypothetical protein [Candidatus Kurthia equi]